MLRIQWTLLGAVVWLATVATLAGEPPLTIAPQEGVLLLKNGAALRGKITAAGDHYYVLLPNGELRLKAADVEIQCSDLADGYRRKRAKIANGKATDHLDLAEWCVRHKLFDEAAKELAAVSAADASQPRLPLIRRRLEQARRDADVPRAPVRPIEHGVTSDELDRMVRGMPKGTVETFTSTIQPLLLNNCTASGCHGPRAEGKLRLLRVQLASPPSRRSTQRNLHSVMQCINAADPVTSPLVTVPLQQHGSTKAAIFTNREADQFRQLVAWVQSVSRSRAPSQPSTVDNEAPPFLQTTSRPRPKGNDDSPAAGDPPQMDDTMPAFDEPEADASDAWQPEISASVYTPVDPFDPEIFNRRYFPRP